MVVGLERWIVSDTVRTAVDDDLSHARLVGDRFEVEVPAVPSTPRWWAPERLAVTVPLAMVLTLIVILLGLVLGPLKALDIEVRRWAVSPSSAWRGPLIVPDTIGRRFLTAPLLVAFAGVLAWRSGRWRPLTLAGAAILALNVFVGLIKIAVGRGSSILENPNLFVGGMMWPSGHASNIAMTMALALYLLRRYEGWDPSPRTMAAFVAAPSLIMCSASVALGFHWLSDLVAGLIAGLLVAYGVIFAVDGAPLWGLVRVAFRPVASRPQAEPRSRRAA